MSRWIFVGIVVALALSLLVYTRCTQHPVHVSALARDVSLALNDGSTVLDARPCDLDSDDAPEVIAITCNRWDGDHPLGGDIVVLRQAGDRLRLLWRQHKMNPWKLQTGDVDGDGRPEVIVGVWKKSPRDPVMAKRTFVYYWKGARLLPKWLGSRLSRRFDDFAVADVDNDSRPEIIALEVAPNDRRRLSVYGWKSFGCAWMGCSGDLSGASSVGARGNSVIVTGIGPELVLQYRDGRVSLKEEIDRHDR